MNSSWMLYGATGYTGQKLAEEAVARGHRPLLAGRCAPKLAKLADRLGVPYLAVDLADAQGLRKALERVCLVFHAAGPFAHTSRPMVEACLEVGAHYLDITGELSVFEAVWAFDEAAKQRGIALLPGMGFDVIPSDCLAAYVAHKLHRPQRLEIALSAVGQVSAGTAKSALGVVSEGVWDRAHGHLRRLPLGKDTRQVQFEDRQRWVTAAPLGDLLTAFHSTGIPNITTYLAVSRSVGRTLQRTWPLWALGYPLARGLLGAAPIQRAAGRWLDQRLREGTSPSPQAQVPGRLWARASGEEGEAAAWLEVLGGYPFTATAGVRAVERVLANPPRGALTPSQALGVDFVLELPGSIRTDVPGGVG